MIKNIVAIALFIVIAVSVQAQNMAKPVQLEAKDMYVLNLKQGGFIYTETIHLDKEQITETTNLEERLLLFIENAPNNSYDAIFTRDGITARLLKYASNKSDLTGVIPRSFKKPVYFFAIPTKAYSIIETKSIQSDDMHLGFNVIAESYVNQKVGADFDAIIISKDKVEYIVFN